MELWSCAEFEKISVHESHKLLVFRRGQLVFLFNFHPTKSQVDLPIAVPEGVDYQIVLDTDQEQFGGFARNPENHTYPIQAKSAGRYPQQIQAYLPCRTAQVLVPHQTADGRP